MFTSIALTPIALVGYAVGIVSALVGTVYRSTSAHRVAVSVFAATWIVHLAAVVQRGMAVGRIPLGNQAEYLLVLGWIVLSLYLLLFLRWRVLVAGVLLPPIAAICTLFALHLMSLSLPVADAERGPWFLFHVVVSTVGIACLSVAFAMSVIYIVNDRALKSRQALRLLERLPSLQKCDRIGLEALALGFVLLSLGIATGVIVNEDVYQKIWVPGVKQVFPLLAWFVFAAILTARTGFGFRGRKSAYLMIAGFAFALMTVFGIAL